MVVDAGSGTSRLLDDPTQNRRPATSGSIVRYLSPAQQVSDRKILKRERLSPPAALARWLDIDNESERELYWFSIKKYVSPSSLPNILLEYLHRSKHPTVSSNIIPHFLYSNNSEDPFQCRAVLLR
jgi:hypothetical protein